MSASRSAAVGRGRQLLAGLRRWWQGARKPTRRPRSLPGVEQLEPREVLAAISGTVFVGLNVADPSNTNPNPGPPVAGALVSLDNGAQVQVTGTDGSYSFDNVPAGSHTVSVLPPDGFLGFSSESLDYTLVLTENQTFPNLNFALTLRNQALVQNLYELVLHRPADINGFNALVGQLDNGGSVGAAFRSLYASSEFRSKVAPLARMLQAFFPTEPVDVGLLRNGVQLQNLGVSQDATVLDILYSPKFVSQFGDTSQLSNSAFVTFVYQRLLGRNPGARQLNSWVSQLDSGTINRGDVVLGILDTRPFRRTQRNAIRGVAVSLAYLGILGREAEPAEFRQGIRQLRAGLSVVRLANRLARSAEFRNLPGFTDTFLWDVKAHDLGFAVNELSRLQRYNPMTQAFDTAVELHGITSSSMKPSNVYFIAHGWALGFEEDVLLHSTPGNPLKVWQTLQFPGGFPTSGPDPAWLYSGVDRISVEGLAQAIVDADPNAVVIAYSWIDQSATPASGNLGLDNPIPILFAGQSEAYTTVNGLRLARAIQAALSPTFFTNQGLIHLLGHSHGSKVATVAALALQQAGVPVTQLTTFESPEAGPALTSSLTLHLAGLVGAQNFNWYFMQQMQVTKTPVVGRTPQPGTFIDNYYSWFGFGQAYGGYPGLQNVVDVELHPEQLYSFSALNDSDFDTTLLDTLLGSHEYPPPWYAQASIQQANPPNGLGWSPLLNDQAAAGLNGLYQQTWTQPVFSQQFTLTPRGSSPNYGPSFTPLSYAQQYTIGQVTDNGSAITLSVDAGSPTAVEVITFNPLAATTRMPGNGLDFRFQFSGVDPGEQVELVIWVRGLVGVNAPIASINEGTLGYLSIPLFAMSGTEAGSTARQATISLGGFLSGQHAPILGPFSASQVPILGFSLIGSAGASATVTVTNLNQFSDGTSNS